MSSKIKGKFASFSPFDRLIICAILSGLIYLTIFTIPFPLTKLYNTIPPVDYTKLTNYSPSGFLLYLFGVGALFGLYIWAIRLSTPATSGSSSPAKASTPNAESGGQSSAVSGRFIFLSSAIFSIILIFSYPLTAIDLFIYAIRTRGWALYGLQPLATPPEALPTFDPWLGLAGEWVDAASPYGPLWEWLSLGVFHLGGGEFLAHLFALKIIGALAYLGCIWFVYQILKRSHPDWLIPGTIAFAWNPLILFESVQNAHNDIVMVFFLLAAIWLFVQIDTRTWRLKSVLLMLLFCVLLAMSILVKFATVIVVPFFLVVAAMRQPTWLHRIAALVLYGAVTIILVIVPMLPFWPGLENWAVLEANSGAGRSLLALLVLGLREFLETNSAFDLSRNFILLIFALIYLYYLWQTFTRQQISISSAFFVLFWYVLLAAPVFHAWYLLWFLPLASFLLPQQRPITAAIVFSITALLIIPYFETIRVWYPVLLHNHLLGHLVGVPLLILPPALTLLWSIRLPQNSEV